jgi:hypothetical protein
VTRTVELTNRSSQPLLLNTLSVSAPFFLQASQPLEIPANGSVTLPIRFDPPFQRQSYQANLTACESNGVSLDIALRGRSLAAEAVFSLPDYELGDVALGDVVNRTLIVSNTGDAPLRMAGWTASDDALTVAPSGAATVQPGAAQVLTLAFDSLKTKCDGLFSGSIELDSNSVTRGRITVKANVRGMEVIAGELNFGPLGQGESRTLNATLINRASLPLTPTVTLAGAPQFRVGSAPAGLVAPGGSIEAPVIYRPINGVWSPFGDHAMLTSARPGCESTCMARVHLIGNIGAEIVPGGGISPTIASAGDTLHVASMGAGIAYAVRDGSGVWSPGPEPAGGFAAGSQPALHAGQDGTLTMLWYQSGGVPTIHEVKLAQRTNGGDWGNFCTLAGRRTGWGPPALDSAGNLWLAWADPSADISYAGPIYSAAGVCQTGQMSLTVTMEQTNEINLVSAPDGLLRIVGADTFGYRAYFGTLNPANGEGDFSYSLGVTVNPGAGLAQAVGADGRWHVAWPGNADFYPELGLEGRDQALYAFTLKGTRFVESLPLMRESSQANGMRMAVDSLGDAHIAWSDQACADPGQRKLYYARGRPSIFYGGWQAIDVTTPDYTGADPTLALTIQDDQLAAAWSVSSGGNPQLLVGEAGVGARAATDVVTATVTPDQGGGVAASDGSVDVQFPAGAVTDPATVTYTRRPRPTPDLGNLLFARHSFALEARDASGAAVTSFSQPYRLTLRYGEGDWQQVTDDENKLNLYYWDGAAWRALLPCAGCVLDTTNNVLIAVLDHMTEFALLVDSEGPRLYLPVVGNR